MSVFRNYHGQWKDDVIKCVWSLFFWVAVILGEIHWDCAACVILCGRAGNREQRVWVLLCPGFYCIQIHVSPSNLPVLHLKEPELSLDLHLPCFSYQQPCSQTKHRASILLLSSSFFQQHSTCISLPLHFITSCILPLSLTQNLLNHSCYNQSWCDWKLF